KFSMQKECWTRASLPTGSTVKAGSRSLPTKKEASKITQVEVYRDGRQTEGLRSRGTFLGSSQ
ncbi:MAG: hypothetical protein PHP62_03005, partial [Candidatus Moranbacteria bacterium]|nr:hypothetical protein [Candidatus Moranbacteria bacterium]